MLSVGHRFAFAFDVVVIDGLNTDANTVRYDISGQNVAVDKDTFPFPVFFADLENPNGCKNADMCAFDYNGEYIKTFDDNVNKVHLAWPYDPNYTHKSVCEAYGIDVDLDGSRGIVEGPETTGYTANRERNSMYVKRNANKGRRANMRRRATGSPDEMGGGTNVVSPLKNDDRNLSDDLSLDAPLNDGADADNADYQPDKAREKAMEARRRRRAMRKSARVAEDIIRKAIEDVMDGGPYETVEDVHEKIDDVAYNSISSTQDMTELLLYYVDDDAITDMFWDEFVKDIENSVDPGSLVGDDYIRLSKRANNRRNSNMYVKRNASKNRIAKKASMRRTASWAAESLAGDIVNDGPYADEDELYDAIMYAIDSSLIYSSDVWRIAQEYCSDEDVAKLFETEYADDVYNEVYKYDMSEVIKGDEGEVEARRRRASKAKQTRQSFRKRAQGADDEHEETPEFVDETGDDDDDEDEDEDEEPEAEEAPKPESEGEDEEREARRAAVRKAMKAAKAKKASAAAPKKEPKRNVRVSQRSAMAGVAPRKSGGYDSSCMFY